MGEPKGPKGGEFFFVSPLLRGGSFLFLRLNIA